MPTGAQDCICCNHVKETWQRLLTAKEKARVRVTKHVNEKRVYEQHGGVFREPCRRRLIRAKTRSPLRALKQDGGYTRGGEIKM
jgi:hypothetical protein